MSYAKKLAKQENDALELNFKHLSAFKERSLNQYGHHLGKEQVEKLFDKFFWPNPEALADWTALSPREQAKKVRSFEQNLKRLIELRRHHAKAEAKLKAEKAVNDDTPAPLYEEEILASRPSCRSECPGYRPCPFVSCRYHLYLDVTRRGRLRFNFPGEEVEDLEISCALDLADDGPKTLEQIGAIMGGISRERVRQIEQAALTRLKKRNGKTLFEFVTDDH